MAGSSSSSDAEVFDADAARRQGQAHNITTASGEEVLPVGETAPQRHASDRAMSAQHNVGPAGGIVEDDLSVEDDIVAGVTTTENPADVRMQVIAQYQGSFKGLGNSASGRYHVHLTPEKSAADDMQEGKTKKLGRQGTLVNLVEVHGKLSGNGDGWIDEGLQIQEDAHSPCPDEDELEVQATEESHFKRRGALMHRDKSFVLATDHVTFEPSKVTALFDTIRSQDFEAVRSLVLEDPRIINAAGIADFAGMSPMHAAAHFGLDRIAALFLRQPAPCRLTKNKVGREPMHEAVISGSIGVMKTLYDGGCYTVDVFDRFGFTALHYASMLAGVQELGILRFLVRLCAFDLEAGVQEVAQMSSVEDSKLWPADHSQILKNRVESHSRIAKIRSHLVDGDTTLHIAVKAGNESAVKDLVDLGASVRAVNEHGKTPLHCVVALATDHAPGHSFQHIFKILLSNNSVVDAVDNKDNSVLHIAASANAVKVLAYLMLHSHVNIHAKNKAGVTPLLIAVQAGHVRCVDLIQGSHPKTLDDVDSRGNSVLHLAAQLDDWRDVVQVLLEFEGADAELKNEQGKTAKDLAVEMGKTELAEMLQNYATEEDKLAMQELESLERRHTLGYRPTKGSVQDDKKLPPLRKDIHHIVRDDDIQNFVKQFAGENAGTALPHAAVPSPRSLTEVNSSTDQVTVIKEFLDRFASRHHFDRFTQWKRKGHGLDPPLSKFTMGYEDMLTLLEKLGLMDHFVSRPEVYKIFCTKAPGQAKATTKEITFSTFRTHMQNFASNAPRELLLKFLSHAEVLQVDSISVSSDRYSSDDDDLDSDTRIDGGTRFSGERIDPCDYVPTVTGINSPATSAPRGSSRAGVSGLTLSRSIEGRPTTKGSFESSASFASRRSRAQSPDRLSDAFRDFSPTHKDKIRVDLDSGHLQQASWAPGTFFTKNKIRDIKRTGSRLQATPDSSLGRGLRSSSRLSMGLSQHSGTSSAQPTPHTLVWKPMGCSRSTKVLKVLEERGPTAQYKCISDLTHYLKPIWIDFSPAVSPMPQLLDAAHEATYAMCFEKSDYVGCFEVIQSSLNLTPVAEVDLYQRMYAQAVVFCNSYALRCIKARNFAAASSLLRKSLDMTAPSVAYYPGRKALLGWTMDTHALYFYERKKMNAALQYMQRAMDHIDRIKSAEGKATWRAHYAVALSACRRSPEAVEIIKDALSEIVGVADGVITKQHILGGRIPHAHRALAASLCFNLAVYQVELHHHDHAITSCRFALLLCHGEGQGANWKKIQRLHDALADFLEARNAEPTLGRSCRPSQLPKRSESTPPVSS